MRDAGIGDVEGRPVEALDVDFEEVDDVAADHAVDQVAEGPGHDEGEGRRVTSFCEAGRLEEVIRDEDQGHERGGRHQERG